MDFARLRHALWTSLACGQFLDSARSGSLRASLARAVLLHGLLDSAP